MVNCAPPRPRAITATNQLFERGTSGLPSVSYLPPNVLNNPAYTTFKSNWAWANLTDAKDFAVKGELKWDPAFITDVKTTITRARVMPAATSIKRSDAT